MPTSLPALMNIRTGIRTRLALLGVLPTAIIGLALAAYFIQTRLSDLNQGLINRTDLLLQSLLTESVPVLQSVDLAGARLLAEQALQNPDVVAVDITGVDGLAVHLSRESQAQSGNPDGQFSRKATVYAPPEPVSEHASAPLSARLLGTISLEVSRKETHKRQQDAIFFSLLVLAAGVGITSLLTRRMVKKITEPLITLTKAVHDLSKGDLDVRVDYDAEAEIAYLQAGFNAMAAELKKNRDILENRVRLATLRLQESMEILEKRNKELEAARWSAEAQTESKSRFLAQMSHEIRTPMNGIIGFAEILAKSSLTREQREQLGLISRSAINLLAIINDILDFSKLEAGKISLDYKPMALRTTLEDIVSLLSGQSPTPAIALNVDADVPDAIINDPVRLQQVVANLLGNAMKFTFKGWVIVRVRRLYFPSKGERLFISVSDSGSGISPQDQVKLFSPFLQLGEQSFSPRRGTGLGLSISKKIVESLGGQIQLASRLGKGTSIWFDVPLLIQVEPVAKLLPLQGVTISLLDENRLFRMALKAQLEWLGATVYEAATLEGFFKGRQSDSPEIPICLYGFWPRRDRPDENLPVWLHWCETHNVRPIVIFPGGERRMVAHYQKRATCLFSPLRNETLILAIKGHSVTEQSVRAESDLPQPQWNAEESHSGPRFLVADDNEINRMLIREQLKPYGGEITAVNNGQEALERLRLKPFDLILLDKQMPLLSGLEVMISIRKEAGPNKNSPIVAITAFASPDEQDDCIDQGFDDCLIKPIMEKEMANLIARFISSEVDTPPAVPKASYSKPQCDYATAILVQTGWNGAIASELARKLSLELPEHLNQIGEALAARNRKIAKEHVHKINGSAAFTGLVSLRQAAIVLESALAVNENFEVLQALLQELKEEAEAFTASHDQIQAQIRQLTANPVESAEKSIEQGH